MSVKVVVFGDSDSGGEAIAGRTWPEILRERLEESEGREVSVESLAFSAVPAGAGAYAERRVSELQPDVVVVVLGSSAFTFKFVEVRVKRLFGDRVARWVKRIESGFDSASRRDGEAGRINRCGRWLARTVIGAEPYTTREQLTESYREVFRGLARVEDLGVVVMVYPGMGDHARRGGAAGERRRFFAALRQEAEAHHFGWVSLAESFGGAVDWREYRLDDLHFTEEGHERIAEAMLESRSGWLRGGEMGGAPGE